MRNKRFNFPSILNIRKDLNDEFNLADVGNEFVSLHDSRYQYFGTFETLDFKLYILSPLFSLSMYTVFTFLNICGKDMCSFENITSCFVLLFLSCYAFISCSLPPAVSFTHYAHNFDHLTHNTVSPALVSGYGSWGKRASFSAS